MLWLSHMAQVIPVHSWCWSPACKLAGALMSWCIDELDDSVTCSEFPHSSSPAVNGALYFHCALSWQEKERRQRCWLVVGSLQLQLSTDGPYPAFLLSRMQFLAMWACRSMVRSHLLADVVLHCCHCKSCNQAQFPSAHQLPASLLLSGSCWGDLDQDFTHQRAER